MKQLFLRLMPGMAVVFLSLLLGHNAARAEEALETLDEIVATLERFDVSGSVVDKEGAAVPGADVYLYYSGGYRDGLRDRLAAQTQTDGQGAFRFEKAIAWEPFLGEEEEMGYDVPKHVVIAKHADHGIYFANLLQGDPTDNVRIVLPGLELGKKKRRSQTIIVIDQDGKAVPGAKVYLCEGVVTAEDKENLGRPYQSAFWVHLPDPGDAPAKLD